MEKSKPKQKDKIMRPSEQLSISSGNRFCSLFNLVLLHGLAFEPYTGWDSFFPSIFLSILLPRWCPFNNPSHTCLFWQQCLHKHINLKSEFAYDDLVCSCGTSGIWLTPVSRGALLCSTTNSLQVGQGHTPQGSTSGAELWCL